MVQFVKQVINEKSFFFINSIDFCSTFFYHLSDNLIIPLSQQTNASREIRELCKDRSKRKFVATISAYQTCLVILLEYYAISLNQFWDLFKCLLPPI